jgi:putative transposase
LGFKTENKTYEQNNKSISRFDLQRILVHEVKLANEWSKKANSQALLACLVNVESAFTKFFREKTGFPRFKSKKNPVQSYQLPQHYTVDFEKSIVKLPKIGEVKAILHRRFEGALKTATISRSYTGKILYKYSCGRWIRTAYKTGILRIYYSGNRCRYQGFCGPFYRTKN